MAIELPKSDARTVVIGQTGSGKTQFSAWFLSTRNYLARPWVIFDFKGDKLIAEIPAINWDLRKGPPKEPGLYVVRPLPGDEMLVSNFLYRCWQQEYIGLYFDEGYMVPKGCRWFRACLTQGRSKQIEMVICSQRPVFLDKFVFTESGYFAIFNINYLEDRKHLAGYLGGLRPNILPRFHCLWYDVGQHRSATLKPVPDAETIVSLFERQQEKRPLKL